jgi:3,4-dihydroxy 2-butanone 4-phosphate synthase/GTP cyclohydrolase II
MRVAPCDDDFQRIATDVMAVIDRVRLADVSTQRPCVTLSYAQSLDGSIAGCTGKQLGISGDLALDFTHRLRAMHDAILVGVNTVLSDDPRLTVRRVEGPNPRPVVVDSHLRIPLDSRLVRRREAAPIIATTEGACAQKAARLAACGAEVWFLPKTPSGRVDLRALFCRLGRHGFASVMVEGGASIITSVIESDLADQLVVTVAPRLLGGVRAVGSLEGAGVARNGLVRVRYQLAGEDLLVHSEFA